MAGSICILSLIILMLIVGVILILALDLLIYYVHQDSRAEIQRIGDDAWRRAQGLSDDYLQKVWELLQEQRR